MKPEDTYLWDFDAEPAETSEVECPDCRGWSPLADWRESEVYCEDCEVYCEDCGTHPSIVCPRCEEHVDCVYGPELRVRHAEKSESGGAS